MKSFHAWLTTPVGKLLLVGSEDALTQITFDSERAVPEPGSEPSDVPLREAIRQLELYFAGKLRVFDLPLAPEGTPFQKMVWRQLVEIPYGTTSSYRRVAELIGRPRAVRAVGAANGQNPIPIVIPCHRVIGSDGSLTGYGGGLALKQALLELERLAIDN